MKGTIIVVLENKLEIVAKKASVKIFLRALDVRTQRIKKGEEVKRSC